MLRTGLRALIAFGVCAGASVGGAILGLHTALTPAVEQRSYQRLLLKATYGVERFQSVGNQPAAFKARWNERIRSLDGRKRRIGVYVGEGTNATPFLPFQLEKAGFDVVRFDLRRVQQIRDCALIVFPGGHYSLAFPRDGVDAVRQYVAAGGGFIGICLGCMAAERLGLVPGALPSCPLTGLISCKVNTSFFKNSKSDMVFLHMNGRLLTAAGLLPIVTWADETMAGTKTFGQGRIVLFSSHPEGGKIEYGNRYVVAEGTSLGTMDLLMEAMFYVAETSGSGVT